MIKKIQEVDVYTNSPNLSSKKYVENHEENLHVISELKVVIKYMYNLEQSWTFFNQN